MHPIALLLMMRAGIVLCDNRLIRFTFAVEVTTVLKFRCPPTRGSLVGVVTGAVAVAMTALRRGGRFLDGEVRKFYCLDGG